MRISALILLALLYAVPVSAADVSTNTGEDIGTVITLAPGAFALRDGNTLSLALHDGIRASDTLKTDAGGRVKILFSDDTSVSLGPNTVMEMREYADAGSKSAFSVHVPQGMIRAITGKIVEQNPGGFKMTSPEATVGIRGTIVTLHVDEGVSKVYVENTLRQVYVNNVNVPSGHKIVLPGASPRPEPIKPEDRRQIGRELAFRGGQGSAAAAREAGVTGDLRRSAESFASAAGGGVPARDAGLKDSALVTQKLGDTLSAVLVMPGSPSQQTPPTRSLRGCGWNIPGGTRCALRRSCNDYTIIPNKK